MAGCKRERNFNLEDMNSHAFSSSCSSTQPTYEIHLFPGGTQASFTNLKTQLHEFCMHVFSVCKNKHILVSRRRFGKWNAKKKHCIFPNVTRLIKWSLFSNICNPKSQTQQERKKITCHFKKPFIITLQPRNF